ncbi:hypothetical protein Tco_0370504 [Tanacetum coccineum]
MSPGNVSPSSFSARSIPGDIPSDKSPGIPRICRWGIWQIKRYPEDMSSGKDWSDIDETLIGKCVAQHGRWKNSSELLLPTSCCRGPYADDLSGKLYAEDLSLTKATNRLLGNTRLL